MARIGEMLVRERLISSEQLEKAEVQSKKSGERLSLVLIKSGALSEDELTHFLSRQYGVPAVNLSEFEIDPEVIALVPREIARKHQVIPMSKADNTLIVAMSDPANIVALDDLKFLTNHHIDVVVASEAGIAEAMAKHYDLGHDLGNYNLDEVMGELDEDVEITSDATEDENLVDL